MLIVQATPFIGVACELTVCGPALPGRIVLWKLTLTTVITKIVLTIDINNLHVN